MQRLRWPGDAEYEMEKLARLLFLVVLWAVSITAQLPPDNRCYLDSGGSGETFFVSEDAPVGSLIGILHILGDPSLGVGNIELHLQEIDSPLRIVPGTKNLTLTRRLDKEGVDGPSSVFVSVICERKRTSDPGFVIPVNIRVTDVNDNTPQFINAPYILNISEVTVVGTRVLQGVKAIDADQQGPFSTVHYSVLPGPHSDYFIFVNPLEGTLLLRRPLDYETLSNFTLTIRAQDQGSPPRYSDAVIYVYVIDADDQNPKFFDERYTAELPIVPLQGTRLKVLPREIAAYDQDVGINAPIYYTFNSATQDYRFFEIDRSSGHVILQRTVPDDELLQPTTLVVRATQYDNPDRYALATLTVSRPGVVAGDLMFIQKHFSASVLENVPLGSVLLTAVTNKPRDRRVRFWLEDPTHSGTFSITQSGDLVLRRALDYETLDNYQLKVHATDGRTNDTAQLEVSVLNVNDWDPRFRYPQYEFFISDLDVQPGDVVGIVEAADGDRGDTITLSLKGPDARVFSINDRGEISIQDISKLNSSSAHFVAVARDSGIPPREASVPVTVFFPEALVRAQGAWSPGGTGFLLMAIFGTLLALLALIIFALVLYIYKHKRRKAATKAAGYAASEIQHKKLPPGSADKVENPVFGDSETATVRVGGRSSTSKVAPAPPTVPSPPVPPSDSTRGIGWPAGSIPRRVKKLSWDDEAAAPQIPKTELDPDVSVTPITGEQDSEQANLTVYF
ncbi:fat-like cadherin-related tumor suppressor homolog [Schistocerca serialis cubense]|uniref:fat-like cadherin-related tumor suppressor homolog n=1 Tax=Schistocerca serialis cubense TaxID=2023355 RepID=UPI00214E5EBD|nr:fat-like cadherin-related tumor suppressor homolog [Schistocerca serialis cubense]